MDLVPKKVAIVGGRDFQNYELMCRKVNPSKDRVSLVVSGGAKGADTLAQRWAKDNAKPILILYPDWKEWGNRAGMLRNKKIIDHADVVIAFWDGKSKGTANAIKLAKDAGKDVHVVQY